MFVAVVGIVLLVVIALGFREVVLFVGVVRVVVIVVFVRLFLREVVVFYLVGGIEVVVGVAGARVVGYSEAVLGGFEVYGSVVVAVG